MPRLGCNVFDCVCFHLRCAAIILIVMDLFCWCIDQRPRSAAPGRDAPPPTNTHKQNNSRCTLLPPAPALRPPLCHSRPGCAAELKHCTIQAIALQTPPNTLQHTKHTHVQLCAPPPAQLAAVPPLRLKLPAVCPRYNAQPLPKRLPTHLALRRPAQRAAARSLGRERWPRYDTTRTLPTATQA